MAIAITPPSGREDAKKQGVKKSRPILFRKWERRDMLYFSMIASAHILCLFAPWTFSWGALWVAVVHYLASGCLGLSLCYHRYLSHGSFKLPKPLEYFFAYLGLMGLQGEPIFWVSTHRYHHKFVDSERDPHSPNEGFWFSHIGWIFDKNYLIDKVGNYGNVADLEKQFYYRFLRSTMIVHVLGLWAALYLYGGFSYLVWGVGVANTFGYHLTFMLNSVCHTWGYQTWNTGDLSRNNFLMSLVTFGDGWHNNHHAFETSARHGLEWYEIDATFYFVKLLEMLGLATKVKVPSENQKKTMAFKNETEYMRLPSGKFSEVKAD